MSQEEKLVRVHLEKREEQDYMIFEFEEESVVCLNNESSHNELKLVFSKLLAILIVGAVKLEFINVKEYSTGLYIDVCKEYINDLNREISNVRKNIPEKLSVLKLV